MMLGLLWVTAVSACQSPATPTPTTQPPALDTPAAISEAATLPPDGYPLPTTAPATESYPARTPTAELIFTPPPMSTLASDGSELYLPLVNGSEEITATPLPPTHTPSPTPTPIPTVDFTAVRAELAAQGLALAPVKIGFHTGLGGNSAGLEQWMRALDAAGVPFFLKSVDNAQPIFLAQELMKQSGVPHILVYRKSAHGGSDYDWNVPNYSLPPEQAAEIHWQMHRDAFPPELDRDLVWLETINEVDKNQAEWLGQFALKTAELAMNEGFRWAAFGWASGEPEQTDWQTPSMIAFLRLAGNNPDQLAIALHEYSYLVEDIGHEYPYKIGRFQTLFQIVDTLGIPRPTVLITEWGWTYEKVPSPEQALQDIEWAARLYAPYPEVKGAAIWFLGGQFAGIADLAQRLIAPVTQLTLQTYFSAPQLPAQAPIEPEQYAP
ncbi:MAG: hypothetical protein H6652_11915 [Ardenticatenaceae bacterium]|nr:hypothetical protein [Ardenticatenaceae bacterium]MCB8949348.1 hypothetical protein [Ardenticatenaceae bacterium]